MKASRRLISVALATLILIGLCACGQRNASTVSSVPIEQTLPITESTSEPSTSVPIATSPSLEPIAETPETNHVQEPEIAIEWSAHSYTLTDNDGYTYEVSLHMSPWILLSNIDIINAAWNDIGNGVTLPEFNDWGLIEYSGRGNLYYRHGFDGGSGYYEHTMTDMYYCLGTIQIRNSTDGWPINSENPRSVRIDCYWHGDLGVNADLISRVFFSNGTSDCFDELRIATTMKSDVWGPVPFIIMAPENYSPKFPEGEYYEAIKNGFFLGATTQDQFNIGIIGKDGKYVAPSAMLP